MEVVVVVASLGEALEIGLYSSGFVECCASFVQKMILLGRFVPPLFFQAGLLSCVGPGRDPADQWEPPRSYVVDPLLVEPLLALGCL